MCGIFGYVGEQANAATLVLKGLQQLEYRGYDSWGIAVGLDDRVAVDKRVGKIGRAITELPPSRIGLGHTRWATHGGVTDDNAHPHLDCSGRIALVHNGIVANDAQLRAELSAAGHTLRSQTDTELIAHLIEDALAQAVAAEQPLLVATMAAFRRLHGLNALVVLDVQTGAMTAAKNGSPLVIGFGERGLFLASDPAALLEHTRDVAFVQDGQAVLLQDGRARLFEIASGLERMPEVARVQWHAQSAELGGYPDYMTKEIAEQPAVLHRIASDGREQVQVLARAIEAAADVIMTGCGSAYHAALAGQYLFARVGRRLTALPGSELGYLAPFIAPQSLIIALSQSGETIDILDAVRAARAQGAQVAALTNVEGSSLWRLADPCLPLGVGPERCVLATKSFTAKLALLLACADAIAGRDRASADIARAASDIAAMLHDRRRAAIYELSQQIGACQHLYVIGRGVCYPLALETALKIKEVSYLHAEGFAGGELKHGVMALIEPGTPCIVLAPEDETLADVLGSAMQVKARGARVIGVSPHPHAAFDHHIAVADAGPATALSLAVVAQLIGYDLAKLRGHDPDMPRNLAKSVTVK